LEISLYRRATAARIVPTWFHLVDALICFCHEIVSFVPDDDENKHTLVCR
jgi:hypothetical protein